MSFCAIWISARIQGQFPALPCTWVPHQNILRRVAQRQQRPLEFQYSQFGLLPRLTIRAHWMILHVVFSFFFQNAFRSRDFSPTANMRMRTLGETARSCVFVVLLWQTPTPPSLITLNPKTWLSGMLHTIWSLYISPLFDSLLLKC